ncbi:similar to Naumovozyma dairenensis NDAI_0G01400 hypothetical protein [Maudiozyma barnettii]|uniref:Dicers-like N-terminal domain-containing protein n=1 Tax=Maudiozyma barnettii TaxID=61262 RepID=A0A8H2VK46_9SACH|nr:uncharacterized protein KABA2_11S04158 [Kazachstania barnettii]CAB4256825.1 similar to Naumovozyma dairenensis NDAI_0G01400 hypothetical protein [Kazachstania barnettii]CAD1785479.1 similar to Naumovozyma dairenensis NDAI_0G01400 hypothetical protein [Kazachstania barnettii]
MPDFDSLRRFYRVHNACIQLRNAMSVIYADGLSNKDLGHFQDAPTSDDMVQGILASPATSIATYLKNAQATMDIAKIIEYYSFDPDQTDLEEYTFGKPILLSQEADFNAGHDDTKLSSLGKNWLVSVTSLVLYERFPFADAVSLDLLRNRILESDCFENFMSNGNGPDRKFPSFDAYIGALIVDRASGFHLEEVKTYIQSLIQEKAKLYSLEMINGLYRKNPKFQVMKLLEGNKLKVNPTFNCISATGKNKKTTIEIKLKNILLGTGSGLLISDAEQNASRDALARKILDQYSIHKNIPVTKPVSSESRQMKPALSTTATDNNDGLPPLPLKMPELPPPVKKGKEIKPLKQVQEISEIIQQRRNSIKPPVSEVVQQNRNSIKPPVSKSSNVIRPQTPQKKCTPGSLDPSKNPQTGRGSNNGSANSSRWSSRQSSVSGDSQKNRRKMGIKGLREKDKYTLKLEERAKEMLLDNAPRVNTDLSVDGPPSFDDDSDEERETVRRNSIINIRRSSVLSVQKYPARRPSMPHPWENDSISLARPLSARFEVGTSTRPAELILEGRKVEKPVAEVSKPASTVGTEVLITPAATPVNKATTTITSDTIDKDAKNKLNILYSKQGNDVPTYFTRFLGPGKFHTICRLKNNPDIILAEADGKSKEVSQLMAASIAVASL